MLRSAALRSYQTDGRADIWTDGQTYSHYNVEYMYVQITYTYTMHPAWCTKLLIQCTHADRIKIGWDYNKWNCYGLQTVRFCISNAWL